MDRRETPLAIKRLRELASRAAHTGENQFSRFLEPSMGEDAERAAAAFGVSCLRFGGYEGAERCVAGFYRDIAPEEGDFPIACVGLRWNEKYAAVGHRDLLGAAMGLGVNRDSVGDVALCGEGGCVFVHRDVADYVAANFVSAGRAALRTEILVSPPEIAPPRGEEIRVTVQAARLDAVLASGYRLSRSEAQDLIRAGLVKRNHAVETRGDVRLEAGDLLSARGFGRLRLESVEGETRRGRLALRLFRYGG